MTYIEGAHVGDSEQLRAWHVNPVQVRDTLLSVYLKQVLLVGFVHLDPHPGNLFVLPDGKLALIDFGMIGEYDVVERQAFRNLIQRVFLRDVGGVVEVLQDLGCLPPDVDAAEFARSIKPALGRFDRALLRGLWEQKSFRLPARYMLLIRCLGLLKSVMTTLTPEETDWVGVISEQALPILMSNGVESGSPSLTFITS